MADTAASTHNSSDAGRELITVVNYRFLGIALGVAVALAVIAAFWHRFQVGRLASSFLDQATSAEADEDWQASVRSIEQYLRVHPTDDAAQVRLARIYGKSAQSPDQLDRAARLYDRALGLASADERTEIQVEQAEIMLRAGRFVEALRQARAALQGDSENARALRTEALSLYYSFIINNAGDAEQVLEALEKVQGMAPTDGELALARATILRRERQDAVGADAVINSLLTSPEPDVDALLIGYEYRKQYEVAGADELLDQALVAESDNPKVLFAAATRASTRLAAAVAAGEDSSAAAADAEQLYAAFAKAAPNDPRGYISRVRDLMLLNRVEEAIATATAGLKFAPNDLMLRIMQTELLLQKPDLNAAEEALTRLDEAVNRFSSAAARGAIADLRLYRDQLRAELLLAQGERQAAVTLMEEILAAKPANNGTEMGAGIERRVLNRYAALAAENLDWSAAADAYDQLVQASPESVGLRLAAAEAWLRAGKPTIAGRRYGDLLQLGQPLTPQQQTLIGVGLARAAYGRALATAPGNRNWDEVAATIERGRKLAPDAFVLELIAADMALTPGSRDDLATESDRRAAALTILRAAEEKSSDSADAMSRLALSYQRLQDEESSDRALARCRELVDSPGALALLEAELLRLRGQFDRAQTLLDEFLTNNRSAANAPLVALRRARLEGERGNRAEAIELLKKFSKQYPKDRELAVATLDVLLEEPVVAAQRDEYFSDLQKWEQHLRETGADATLCELYQAKRLLKQSTTSGDRDWLRAVKLQAQIEAARPTWPEAYVLLGEIRRRLNRHASACEALQQAIRLGDQRPTTLVPLVDSLYREGRFAEAAEYLALVEPLIPVSEGLSELAISVAGGAGASGQAVAYARRRVAEEPDDSGGQVWLGYALTFANQLDEAEAAFRKAVEMAPANPMAWNGLLAFYLRTGRTEDAHAVLDRISDEDALPSKERDFLMGQGFELLGESPQAQARYEQALQESPDNPLIRLRLARLLAGKDAKAALAVLRKSPAQTPESRRMMAGLLATLGGEENWREALQLLSSDSGDDRRARAFLLASRGDADGRELARDLFEQLVGNESEARNEDRLVLARLYEYEDKDALARDQFRIVASQPDARAAEVAAYVDFLIRQNDLDDAEIWLERLDELEINPLTRLALRVRILAAQENSEAVASSLDEFLAERLRDADDAAQAKLLAAVAELCTSITRYDLAEKYLGQIMNVSPTAYLGVALAKAKQGRTEDAVQMCLDRYAASKRAVDLQSVAMVLLVDPDSTAANDLAESALNDGVELFADQAPLLNLIGAVRHLQGRANDALAVYERALQLDPDSPLTLNNIATLLSEQPRRLDDSLNAINLALEKSPNNPMLLDTKAMILYFSGKADEAKTLLADVVRMRGADARTRFHLALVEQKLGNAKEAQRWYEKAVEAKIQLEVLTPKEHDLLDMLRRAVSPQAAASPRATLHSQSVAA
ncbi:MAG: tetratricopeptide repeat protein [Planctomycetales bacterium]|nr:tetratricopeptide repeat protein [Planctomycetales bacterium]